MSSLPDSPPLPDLPVTQEPGGVSPSGSRTWEGSLAPALAAAGGTVCAMIYSRLAVAGIGIPMQCRWFRWTGIPCPGCGGTRCLAACGRLDFLAAWRWHPLVTVVALAFLAWPLLVLTGRMLRVSWPERLIAGIGVFLTRRRIFAIVALNWLYLCWALPR